MGSYYAIQVAAGREEKIRELLTKRYGRQALFQRVEIIIPRHLVRCKNKNVWKPIWPGYLILKCADLSAELYYMLKQMDGVIRVLTSPISPEEWDWVYCCSRLQKRLELVRQLLQRKREKAFIWFVTKKRNYPVRGLGYKPIRVGPYRRRWGVLLN